MSTSAAQHGSSEKVSLARGVSPADIRRALLPEDREPFDEAYSEALEQARRSYDITPLLETIEEYRCHAIAQSDPVAFRRSVRRAAEFFSGEPVPDDEPFAMTRVKAGM